MLKKSMEVAKVVGIVGWSGSGKTTLLEFLLSQLVLMNKKINVIKHSHHDLILEPAKKDSARLRQAGATEVMLSSPYRYALIHELREEVEPTLEELIARLAPADLIMVEGFKWAAIPKLEVHRPSLGKVALYPDDVHIVAVASDVAAPVDLRSGLTWLNLNQPADVLDWLIAQFLTSK